MADLASAFVCAKGAVLSVCSHASATARYVHIELDEDETASGVCPQVEGEKETE